MIPKSIDNYIIFGTEFRYLMDAQPGLKLKGENLIYENLSRFLQGLIDFNLKITYTASYDLRQYKEKVLDPYPKEHILTEDEASEITKLMVELRPTLYAESSHLLAYILSDKRFTVEKLMTEISTFFPPGIFDQLSDNTKVDLQEAGKCIAVNRPTAAAFHILRATESTLRDFYRRIALRNRVDNDLWGEIIKDLRSRRKSPPKELLDNLDNIRFNFRNPTQHPDKFYDIEEVQDLFSLCIDVICRMAKYKLT